MKRFAFYPCVRLYQRTPIITKGLEGCRSAWKSVGMHHKATRTNFTKLKERENETLDADNFGW